MLVLVGRLRPDSAGRTTIKEYTTPIAGPASRFVSHRSQVGVMSNHIGVPGRDAAVQAFTRQAATSSRTSSSSEHQ